MRRSFIIDTILSAEQVSVLFLITYLAIIIIISLFKEKNILSRETRKLY